MIHCIYKQNKCFVNFYNTIISKTKIFVKLFLRTARPRRTLQTSFGVTQALTPSAAFSVFAHSRLTAGDPQAPLSWRLVALSVKLAFVHANASDEGTPLASRVRPRGSPRRGLGAHLSPVISVSASYKLHGRETSIAKSLARASQKYTQQWLRAEPASKSCKCYNRNSLICISNHTFSCEGCTCLSCICCCCEILLRSSCCASL